MQFPQTRKFTPRRRMLRKNAPRAERHLWKFLRNKQLGVRIKRQFSIDTYIVDFYCHAHLLVIEIDGYIHNDPTVAAYDKAREAHLQSRGLVVVRYRNEQVLYETESVLLDLRNRIASG